jgi:hypothetical protein
MRLFLNLESIGRGIFDCAHDNQIEMLEGFAGRGFKDRAIDFAIETLAIGSNAHEGIAYAAALELYAELLGLQIDTAVKLDGIEAAPFRGVLR